MSLVTGFAIHGDGGVIFGMMEERGREKKILQKGRERTKEESEIFCQL